ncbi:hypothetical protein LCGC14_2489800 [marine sediment metagenome]|uniref:Uncharacterized protein n=1 Tax=marine sediment metagenome TaxID=412755 RepID=A0A0F9DGV8_9ZZZZ
MKCPEHGEVDLTTITVWITPSDYVDFAELQDDGRGDDVRLYRGNPSLKKELEKLQGATMVEVKIIRPDWEKDSIWESVREGRNNSTCPKCGEKLTDE